MSKKADFSYISINLTGFVLAFVAGWIDVLALNIFFNENASFMTGRIAKLGRSIFNGDINGIKNLGFIILSFILGAFISAFITQKSGLSFGLYLSGISIMVSAVILLFLESKAIAFVLILIPFSLGTQNAATSLTPIGRTTHLTGPITDIGINIAKGNWKEVLFLGVRFFAFVFGTIFSYFILKICNGRSFYIFLSIIAAGITVVLTAFLQKKIANIPLLKK